MGIVVGAMEYLPGGHLRIDEENRPANITVTDIELVKIKSLTSDPYLAPWARDLMRLCSLFGMPGVEREEFPNRVLFVRNLPNVRAVYELFPGFLRRVVDDPSEKDIVLHRERIKRLLGALEPEDPIMKVAMTFFGYYGIGRATSTRRKANVLVWLPKVWACYESNEVLLNMLRDRYPNMGLLNIERRKDGQVECLGEHGRLEGFVNELGLAVMKEDTRFNREARGKKSFKPEY